MRFFACAVLQRARRVPALRASELCGPPMLLACVAGSALLDRGKLESALLLFEEASALVNPKSNAGGRANLQRAITLDSIGRHAEARPLYEQLARHRDRDVAKSAKSMAFGFVAGAPGGLMATRPAPFRPSHASLPNGCSSRGRRGRLRVCAWLAAINCLGT